MTKLQEILETFNNKLADIKYQKAVSLLELLSDEEYALLCDDNEDLIGPISGPDGEAYLHRQDVLDLLIETFTRYIEDQKPDPDRMNEDELRQYIESLVIPADEEKLRGIAKVMQHILGIE